MTKINFINIVHLDSQREKEKNQTIEKNGQRTDPFPSQPWAAGNANRETSTRLKKNKYFSLKSIFY